MHHAAESEANRVEIAAAHQPHPHAVGNLSQGEVRPHCPRPVRLFPSTVNLWKRLYRDEGLQVPRYEGLEEHVFKTLTRMYETFECDRKLIGPGQFCEIRYEELVADPDRANAAGLRENWSWAISTPCGRRSTSILRARRTTRRTATR